MERKKEKRKRTWIVKSWKIHHHPYSVGFIFILLPLEIQFSQYNLLNGRPVGCQGQVVQGPVPCAGGYKRWGTDVCTCSLQKDTGDLEQIKGKGNGGVCWLSNFWEGSKPSLRWELNCKPDPQVAAFKVCSWIPFREILGKGHFYFFLLHWILVGIAVASASMFINNCSIVFYWPVNLVDTSLSAFHEMLWESIPQAGVLKVEVLNVESKPFIP